MTITAKIIADSVSPNNIRLTTLQLRYPKFIHGEFMTHRVFSRNASSSRAIPVERLIQDVIDDPAMPVFWGKNQKGMQATVEHENPELIKSHWIESMDLAINQAKVLSMFGIHKQIVNRIIEPWCHINVVVTATDWTNFFALRLHKDAQPEMRTLAECMKVAMNNSMPKLLQPGQWHLPYITQDDKENFLLDNRVGDWQSASVRGSVARCARVSYLTHEGTQPRIEDDLRLYEHLIGSVPLHASPAEHQATPDIDISAITGTIGKWMLPQQHGNFRGWRQYRKMLPDECVSE